MEDVLNVYCRDFAESEVLVCLDETAKQLITETRESLSARRGSVKKTDAEYKRNGTTNIFMVVAPLEGKRFVRVTDRRTRTEYAHMLRELSDKIYPEKSTIVLVQDNLNTHDTASLYATFEPAEARRLSERFEFHYTPKHGSWLNIAEIELSVLGRQCTKDFFANAEELRQRVMAWETERNTKTVGVNWRFTTADARVKLKKLYPIL